MKIDRKVCVLGLGYIGLPTAALLANRGYLVHGVDINRKVVETVNKGGIHIVEPDLDTFVRAAIQSGLLKASIKPSKADVFIIAVPTPFHEGYIPNIDYVLRAANSVAPYVQKDNIVILESTSPVGTTSNVRKVLEKRGVDISKIHLAYCPERVLPGNIMKELIDNDRIIGGVDARSSQVVAEFYKTFVNGEIFLTDDRTAEMAKLVENSYRDVNIAFANELSILCDKFGINVKELITLANKHPRVKILHPGCGVGGHCIAVDPWFLVDAGGEDTRLIKTARFVNDYKMKWVFKKIKDSAYAYEKNYHKRPKIACLGLAYKPDIDDLRESPALEITMKLIAEKFDVLAVEPNIETHALIKIHDCKKAIENADIIVFLVGHKEFKELELKGKIVFDFCGVRSYS